MMLAAEDHRDHAPPHVHPQRQVRSAPPSDIRRPITPPWRTARESAAGPPARNTMPATTARHEERASATWKTWFLRRPPGLDAASADGRRSRRRSAAKECRCRWPRWVNQLADPHQQHAARRQANTRSGRCAGRRSGVTTDSPRFGLERVETGRRSRSTGGERGGRPSGSGLYWVIRAWPHPRLPFESFSREGTATCSSCRMIDAVMLGHDAGARRSRSAPGPPPEKRFQQPEDVRSAETASGCLLTARQVHARPRGCASRGG